MTKATQVLAEHHDILRDLLDHLSRTALRDVALRRVLTRELHRELQIHEQIEDEIFYPAVRNLTPHVASARSEHRMLADQLATVLRTDPRSDRLDKQVRVLRHVLESHASLEEERQMFPEVERFLAEEELELLGERLERRLAGLRSSTLLRVRLCLKRALLRGIPSPMRSR